jgi:hypothetical protein
MRDVKTIEEKSRLNGNSTYPSYPKTEAATTIRHVLTNDSLAIWAMILILALAGAITLARSDMAHRQIAAVRVRMSASEADRHEIHQEIKDIAE